MAGQWLVMVIVRGQSHESSKAEGTNQLIMDACDLIANPSTWLDHGLKQCCSANLSVVGSFPMPSASMFDLRGCAHIN